MDMRKMFNENPFDKSKKVTVDEIMIQRVEKMKEEVIEGERFNFRIPDNTSAREMVRLFSEAFYNMGIEIVCHENNEIPYLSSSTGLRNPIMDISIRRISDQNIRRIVEIEGRDARLREKIRQEVEAEFRAKEVTKINLSKTDSKTLKRLRDLAGISSESASDIAKKRKKIEENKKNGSDVVRRLLQNSEGKLNWSAGKSFEEARIKPKNTEYQDKIKWFCEKYGENYEIIYESFKDDDLNNLTWKGEKVEFPKKLK